MNVIGIVVMRLLSIVLLFLSLGACDERRQDTSAVDSDMELMKDAGTAGPELEKRLADSISVQDGLIIVKPHLTSFISSDCPPLRAA